MPRWKIPSSPALALTKLAAHLSQKSGRLAALPSTLKKWLSNDVFDTSNVQRALNFNTLVKLPKGLCQEVAWYRSQHYQSS